MTRLLSPSELESDLKQVGATRYHNLHPFHRLLHSGQCSVGQVRAWALNRYYYQSMIPVKDATVLARMEQSELRRAWCQRIIDHDGDDTTPSGIEKWLKLAEGVGLHRDDVIALRGVLPATRFAVNAYVDFCAKRPLLEAIASSLTEMFSPQIIGERVSGMLAHYPFITPATLAYFTARPTQAKRDADFALDYVKTNAKTPEQQQAVIAALSFKCDVLWAQLDALYAAYVLPGHIPPGALRPEEAA
jgi:pyrroloquinoline quinone biosynthesis protein D